MRTISRRNRELSRWNSQAIVVTLLGMPKNRLPIDDLIDAHVRMRVEEKRRGTRDLQGPPGSKRRSRASPKRPSRTLSG
jgi:hypothetical protein